MQRTFPALLLVPLALLTPVFGRALTVGDAAPALKVFRWIKGKPVKAFEPGHLYVIEFWATWCGPCKESIPHLTKLAKQYQKVTFAGISVAESETQQEGNTDTAYIANVRKFVAQEGAQMNYNVGVDGPSGAVLTAWLKAANEDGIPTAFVINKQGKVAWIGHPNDLEPVLKKVVAGTYDLSAAIAKRKAEDLTKVGQEAKEQAQQKEDAAKQKAEDAKHPNAEAMKQYIADMQAGKFKEAQVDVDKVIAAHPEWSDELQSAKFDAMARQDPNEANEYARKIMTGEAKNNPHVLNSIAWAMIDDEVPLEGMDTQLAEKMAAQALSLLDAKVTLYAETLDTLALAQYKNGKQGDAAANEARAVELYSKAKDMDQETLKEMRTRLTKYQNIKV